MSLSFFLGQIRPCRDAPSARRWGQPRRKGAATVEFAVVVPVALLLVVGSIEFGRAMFLQQLAVNTARTACRQAILTTASTAAVHSSVNSQLKDLGVKGGKTSLRVNGQTGGDVSLAAPGQPIEVTVTIPYSPNTWIPSPFYLNGKSLTGRVIMAKE